ncbi:hypothetical protein GCM10027341_00540 [Spirosoma knui]
MAQIYCRKIDGFEFVICPHHHNHVAIINTGKGLAFKPVFSSEAFHAPCFEVNVQNAYFRYKNRLYRVCNAEELPIIPDWFRKWFSAGQSVKMTMNAEEKFMLDGIKTKREAYLTNIGFFG